MVMITIRNYITFVKQCCERTYTPLGKIVFGNMPQFLCLTSNFLNRGMKLLERGIDQMYYFLLYKE